MGARNTDQKQDYELDVEALLSEMIFGHGFLHYGYFPQGRPDQPSTEAFGRAQQAFFDKLAASIPKDVTSILDVGSGTGSNAAALVGLGYELECVCPSEQLNEMARDKLGPEHPVHTTRFEAFNSEKRFDLCIFAESFHYIDLTPALAQIDRYGAKGAVIFDYFRRPGRRPEKDGTHGTHAEFLAEVARQGKLQVTTDEDMTEAISPTFYIFDCLMNTRIAPFVMQLRTDLRRTHPWRAFLAERLLRRSIRRMEQPSRREEKFLSEREYRLIRLERV